MKCVVAFLTLVAAASALTCPTCMEMDWGTINMTAYNVSSDVEGYNNCDSPATVTCATGEDTCMNGTLTETMGGTENGTDWTLEYTYVAQMCIASNTTCSGIHDYMAVIMSELGYTTTFKSCDIDLCLDGNCTDMPVSGAPAAISFLVVSLAALYSLL